MSSSDARSTLQGMFDLIKRGVFQPSTIVIYTFLRLHYNEVLKYEDIKAYTGLHINTIYSQITKLEAANLVDKIEVGKSFKYATRDMPAILVKELSTPTTSSSSSSRLSRLSRIIQSITTSGTSSRKNLKYNYSRGRREAVFVDDKDWIAARAILAKYIPESFLDPLRLGEKRFMKLCELLLDESFDLKAYSKWYRTEKFVRLRFNWNMFLLPSMVDEYRIMASDLAESEQHLHTNSKEMRAKHAKAAEKDMEWIRKKIMPKVGKNGSKTRSKKSSTRDS